MKGHLTSSLCIIYKMHIFPQVYAYCCMRNVLVVGVGIKQLPKIWLYESKSCQYLTFGITVQFRYVNSSVRL